MKTFFVGKVDRKAALHALSHAAQVIGFPRSLDIYFVEDPKKFGLVLKRLPHGTQNIIKHVFNVNKISFSTSFKGKDIVVIMLDRRSSRGHDALVGLILHEIMHIRQQNEGLTEQINGSFQEVFLKRISNIKSSRFSDDELTTAFVEVGLISTLLLKDLYVATALLEDGQENFVVSHYKSRFSDKRLSPSQVDRKTLRKVMRLNLSVLTAYARFESFLLAVALPLKRMCSVEADDVRKSIFSRYSKNTISCERRCKPLIDLYLKEFSYSKSFQRKFFNVMFDLYADLLE